MANLLQGEPPDVTKRTKRIAGFMVIALTVALADLLTKGIAAAVLGSGPVPLADPGSGLRFVLVHNELSAYGLYIGPLTREINVIGTLAALLLALSACGRLRQLDPLAPLALGLIAGAALGNLWSMIVSPGGVVDFIALPLWGGNEVVFNLADVAAYLGLILLVRPALTLCRLIRVERNAKSAGFGIRDSGFGFVTPGGTRDSSTTS